MRKINKRYFRSMRTNRSFHLVVILLTVLIGTLIIAAISTASLMGQVYRQGIRDCNTEDAQFMTMFPIPEDRIGHLEERYAVKLESMTYYDEEAGDYVLRLAAENTAVNTCQVTAGNAPAGDGEVMLSERFADAQGLHIGDSVQIGGTTYSRTLVALSPGPVSDGGGYQALWGGRKERRHGESAAAASAVAQRPAG